MAYIQKDFIDTLFSIKDRVALVTEASGALGSAIAMAYAMSGARVVLTGSDKEKLNDVAERIAYEGFECAVIPGDLAKIHDVRKIVKFAVQTYGELNILAATHSYNSPKSILEQSVEEWQTILDAGLKSVYIVCKVAAEQMAAQGHGGKIVLISSAHAKMGMAGCTGYCAAKGACDRMIQSMACDLTTKYGINVNTINSTAFRSDWSEWMLDSDSAADQDYLKRLPIGRLGEPSDLVGLAILLASPASDFLTGGNYDATGGDWAC